MRLTLCLCALRLALHAQLPELLRELLLPRLHFGAVALPALLRGGLRTSDEASGHPTAPICHNGGLCAKKKKLPP